MEKEILYLGKTAEGVFSQSLFGSSGVFEKVAGAPPFADWTTGEQLRAFVRTITPSDRRDHMYVLVNALGAGEYYGPNINADYFPWDSLAHQGIDYGYETFLNANAFQHHVNKDPMRAFGTPVLSLLNPQMKRVELVIKMNKERARAEGADGVLNRIEHGEFPDVSMGCKVPFDVCSICGHKSKTRQDYCIHMRPPEELRAKFGPNRILEDGRKVFVINTVPRFFDISFVFVGADKTAKVMAKLAQKGRHVCLGNACAIPNVTDTAPSLYGPLGEQINVGQEKTASCEGGLRGPCGRLCATCASKDSCHEDKLASAFGAKTAAQSKKAEIVKSIPVNAFSMKTLPKLEKGEPDMSEKDLDSMSRHPMPRVLGTATSMGIVLKPQEFQHLILRQMGQDDLLSELNRNGQVFRQGSAFRAESQIGDLEPLDQVFHLLKKYIKARTTLGSPFQIRVVIDEGGGKNALPTRQPIEHSLLDKVSAAYNSYRRNLLKKLSQAEDTVRSDSKLRDEILSDGLSNMFIKTSNTQIISPNTVAYMMSAHLQNRSLLCESAMALSEEWLLRGDHNSA
jgi:hypothetical protein